MTKDTENIDYKNLMKNALLEIKNLRLQINETHKIIHEPIAIIGMACQFPGKANNTEKFWEILKNGEDTITEVPIARWNVNDYYDANHDVPGKTYTRYGSFLESVDQFDPLFFGISPREALSMDPQQRILLEVTWEALKNALLKHDDLKGSSTGVFIGVSTNEYGKFFLDKENLENIDIYVTTGNALNAAAGRLSYVLGLQGPCMAIDTACSSSLVAIHNACQSLRFKECNMAIAGGVHLMLGPETTIALSKTKLLSEGGRCKTFDDSADGIVRGEGCGVVILKRLSDALKDNDPVLAVIKSSVVNQDGASSGFIVPNGSAQKKLIKQALENANLQPNQIDYIEAHGTGTALGDPIEVNAIASVFSKNRDPENPLLIGSVKTNIGHLEAAAGIASLIKVVLSLQNNAIPPHLNVKTPNSNIPWKDIPLKIVESEIPWNATTQKKRIAGISSFGASGTNAHLIVEEAENVNRKADTNNLPETVFQKQRYWIDNVPSLNRAIVKKEKRKHVLLDEKIYSPFIKDTLYENYLNIPKYKFLQGHQIHNAIVIPGAFYISTLLAAAKLTFKNASCILNNVTFYQPLVFASIEDSYKLHLNISNKQNKKSEFSLASFHADVADTNKEYRLHASGELLENLILESKPEQIDINKLNEQFKEVFDGIKLYEGFEKFNVNITGAFRWINKIWKGEHEAIAFFKMPNTLNNDKDFELHPCIIDSCIQFASTTLAVNDNETYIPFSIAKITFYQSPQTNDLWCNVTIGDTKDVNKPLSNVKLSDTDGNLILKIEGLEFRKINATSINSKKSTLENHTYQVSWKEKPLNIEPAKGEHESWLIFSDSNEYQKNIVNQLSDLGYKTICVQKGDDFKFESDCQYQINPSNSEHYKKLLSEVSKENCKGIIHLWSLTDSVNEKYSLKNIHDSQVYGCYSAFQLIQAMPHYKWKAMPKLFIVTNSIHNPDLSSTPVNFQHASLWALGKVIMNEYPEYNCKLIDLSISENNLENMCSKLVSELFAGDNEKEVAVRNGNRYVARVVRYSKNTTISKENTFQEFDKDASYLVTGGLGDLGIKVVSWMAAKGAKHIICTGRNNVISDYAKKEIEKFENEGIEIKVMQADVADSMQMHNLFIEIKKTMLPLKGIIHAAGVVDDGLLMGQSIEKFKKVFRPKMDGLWNLHLLSKDLPLDFFVCFSSMASIWTFPGQGNYAAANAFMDALMRSRQQAGLPALSINWGPWAEIGMAARLNKSNQNRMQDNGIMPLIPDVAIQQLEEIFVLQEVQVAVVTIDWQKILKLIAKGGNPLLFDEFSQEAHESQENKGMLLKKLAEVAVGDRKNYLFKFVQAEIARVLGIADLKLVEARQPLFDLGLDSFMAVELKNKLEKDLNVTLTSSLLFNHPNLESIVNFLISDVIQMEFSDNKEKQISGEDIFEKEVYEMSLDEVNDELDNLLKDIN